MAGPALIAAVVQARMGSQRLPGKVLRPLHGKPALTYMLERLERCRSLDTVVVATSTESEDDPVADFCAERGVECHRGPLADVAGRFLEVVDRHRLSAFARVNGDSPLLDGALVDRAVGLFRDGELDLVTNVFPRTFPSGQSVEVVAADALREACAQMSTDHEREHVTAFLYRHPELFRILNFVSERDHGELHLSLDTARDAEVIEAVLARMERPHWEYSSVEVVGLYRSVEPILSAGRAP